MVVAAAQSEAAPPAELSLNSTAGPGWDAVGLVGPKLRLLVSAVKPWATQVGAARPP